MPESAHEAGVKPSDQGHGLGILTPFLPLTSHATLEELLTSLSLSYLFHKRCVLPIAM